MSRFSHESNWRRINCNDSRLLFYIVADIQSNIHFRPNESNQ